MIMEDTLREIGLNETEIKIYSTLLKIGEAKSGEIIKDGKIKSGRVYEFFNSLVEKGLISYNIKNGVKHFSATEPTNLYRYLDKKKQELDSRKDKLKELLPALIENSKFQKKSVVEVYEGLEGIKNAFAKELKYKEGEELLCMGVDPVKTYDKRTVDFFVYNFFKQREKFKIRKIFGLNSKGEKEFIEKNAKYKYVDDTSLTTTDIIGNLVIMHLHHEKDIAITIEDKDLAASLRTQFNSIWKNH